MHTKIANRFRTLEAAAAILLASNLVEANELQRFTSFSASGYARAATGGLREVANGGVLTLTGLPATRTGLSAFLYWHGYRAQTDYNANRTDSIVFNGQQVTGNSIGMSGPNGWGYLGFKYGQAFRANVSSLVTGDASYTIAGSSFLGLNINGASLLVFYQDPNLANPTDYIVYDGNDSNGSTLFDSPGWNLAIAGVHKTVGKPVWLELHVSDGQWAYQDSQLLLNNQPLVPAGQVFPGSAPYDDPVNFKQGDPTYMSGYTSFFQALGFDINKWQGSLWDVRRMDISTLLTDGVDNLVNLNSSLSQDDLGLIVAVVGLPSGAVVPPPPPNNQAPTLAMPPATYLDCAPVTGLPASLTINVSDAEGDSVNLVWKVDGVITQLDTVPAGAPGTVYSYSMVNTYLLGTHTVTVTATDQWGALNVGTTQVVIRDYDKTPAVLNCGPEVRVIVNAATDTAPVPNVLPQVGVIDNCLQYGPSTLVQAPAAGSQNLGVGSWPITVTATDPAGNQSSCQVNFVVATSPPPPPPPPPNNQPPVALDDAATTPQGVAVTTGNVLANDSDPDGQAIQIVAYDGRSQFGATVVYNGNGSFTYTPVASFFGVDSFTYAIADTAGAQVKASVRVTVVQRVFPPVVECAVGTDLLWPPNHKMVCVNLSVHTQNVVGPVDVTVFSNQDDETPTGDGRFSPDAQYDVATGKLWLRAERKGNTQDHLGRVYLIVVQGKNSAGQTAVCTATVGVPHDQSAAAKSQLQQMGAQAQAYYSSHQSPPPDYFPVGEPGAPVIGPKQNDDGEEADCDDKKGAANGSERAEKGRGKGSKTDDLSEDRSR